MQIDELDRAVLRLLIEEPRAGTREHARLLGVARGTVQARIARLERAGVITSYAAHVSPAALGFPLEAFIHLHLAQGKLDEVSRQLTGIPELLQAHSTTGEGDLLCWVATRDNTHLEQVIQRLLALPGVIRTRTDVGLSQRVPYRVQPLLVQGAKLADR